MNAVFNQTTYSPTEFPNADTVTFIPAWGSYVYCSACNGTFTLGFLHTSFSQANGVYGVGFNYYDPSFSPQYTALVTFGDGSTQNIVLQTSDPPSVLNNYFGITSDLLIASIAIGGTDGVPFYAGSGFLLMDNLTVADNTTPLPAALPLFATGLAGMGWLARLKRKQAT